MRRLLRLGWMLTLCGCLRGFGAVGGEAGAETAIELSVRDRNGAVWRTEQPPRWPVFVLQFADPPRAPEQHLFLLRGSPPPEVLADLGSATLRAATQALRLGLQVEGSGRALRAQPTSALEPGASYALVWADLHGQRLFPFSVSASPAAGARLLHSLPALLERQVPPNLARALLQFDGYVRGELPEAVRLLDATGNAVPGALQSLACAELGLGEGDCLELSPERELEPGARYRIAIDATLQDATGAALPAQEIAFETAPQRDLRPPAWLALECALDELAHGPLCILVGDTSFSLRARADENGVLSLALDGALVASLAQSGDYALAAELAQPGQALLQLEDLAGNSTQLSLALEPALDLPKLSIDEVRADALGPEPSQEYVELLNFGQTSMSITGFTLSTDARAAGQRIEGEQSLAAGERALLVAPDFDPADAHDETPAQGVRLVRLSAPLALRNDGDALYLRDPRGRRVSASPALAPEQPGQCIARSGQDPRGGARSDFALDPHGGCTPGYASELSPDAAALHITARASAPAVP